MVQIAPSILSADFGRLRQEVQTLESAGADLIHIDVMDGVYVPNLTIGPMVVKALRPYSNLEFDVHLMVQNADRLIDSFIEAGADIITVHAEACPHLDKTLAYIRSKGVRAGVALNPATDENVLKYVLDKIDLVLVMSVNPGFGGQKFIASALDKISRIKKMVKGFQVKIEVDGGINTLTAEKCVAAGADILVAGTAVFENSNYKKNIESLK